VDDAFHDCVDQSLSIQRWRECMKVLGVHTKGGIASVLRLLNQPYLPSVLMQLVLAAWQLNSVV
jgi:hypothetical protein